MDQFVKDCFDKVIGETVEGVIFRHGSYLLEISGTLRFALFGVWELRDETGNLIDQNYPTYDRPSFGLWRVAETISFEW